MFLCVTGGREQKFGTKVVNFLTLAVTLYNFEDDDDDQCDNICTIDVVWARQQVISETNTL